MSRAICVILFFVCAVACPAVTHAEDPLSNAQWESLGKRKGVLRSRSFIKPLGLYAVRGELVVGRPIDIVASIICDHTRWAEWTKTLAETKIIGTSNAGHPIVYQAFDMPVLVSDRDVVYTFGLKSNGDQLVITGQTVPGLPNPKTKGVRMSLNIGKWTLTPTPQGETHLVVEVLMDPKGRLPKWFVNIAQRNYASDTLANLRDQAKKSDIRPLARPINGCALSAP